MNTWFTADPHFGHGNIVRYCNRPFKDSVEMDKTIIGNWNSIVAKEDLVYLIGDFCFGKSDDVFDYYFKQLNGLIVFVKGNHDRLAWKNREKFYSYSEGYREININDRDITLNHYAQVVWNKKHFGAWMLCGHSHYNLTATHKDSTVLGKILDVGLDGNNFFPYSFSEINAIMEKKPEFTSIAEFNDHHSSGRIKTQI